MAAGNPNQARKEPCRFVLGPTQNPTGNTYPFGGTQIGLAKETVIERRVKMLSIPAEEFGGAEVAHSVRGIAIIVRTILRGWDADAIDALLGGTASDGIGVSSWTVTDYLEGQLMTGVKLAMVPEVIAAGDVTVADSTEVMDYLDDAAYMWDESAKMQRSWSKEYGMPVAFIGRPASSGRIWQSSYASKITGVS